MGKSGDAGEDRKLVTVEEIKEIQPIEGADRIEAARVRNWWVVVKKGEFEVGDKCRFYEIDSFLPLEDEYMFLLNGKNPKEMVVEGKKIKGIRLRSIRLRGQISQGLALPITDKFKDYEVGVDITEELGVVKYENASYIHSTKKGNFPSFLQKTNEERIQNCEKILELEEYKNHKWYVAEKLDGTSATFYKLDGVFGVCSRNLELKRDDSCYWQIADELELEDRLPDGLCLQGEIVGPGIQNNPYELEGRRFYFFNIYDIKEARYHSYPEMKIFHSAFNISMVPILRDGVDITKYSVEQILEQAEGKSMLNSKTDREGIVCRSEKEERVIKRDLPTRLSFKAISNKYLLNERD